MIYVVNQITMQQEKHQIEHMSSSQPSSPIIVLINVTWNVAMRPPYMSRRIIRCCIVSLLICCIFMVIFHITLFTLTPGLHIQAPKYIQSILSIRDEEADETSIKKNVQHRLKSRMQFSFDGAKARDEVANSTAWDADALSIVNSSIVGSSTGIVILITSRVENWHKRHVIRKTWCNNEITKGDKAHYSVQCIFLLGQSTDADRNSAVRRESDANHDMIIGSFIDTYRNLSLKVLTGFQWVNKHFSAKYILKTDDDCFVNTRLLSIFMLQLNPVKEGLYVGNVFRTSYDTRVIRNPESKWYVSKEQFPFDYYPNYASGTGYLMSSDVLSKMLHHSMYNKPFPNEDAYVGYMMEKAGVSAIHSYRFTLYSNKWSMCNMMFLIVMHDVKVDEQEVFQETANRAWTKCMGHPLIRDWA